MMHIITFILFMPVMLAILVLAMPIIAFGFPLLPVIFAEFLKTSCRFNEAAAQAVSWILFIGGLIYICDKMDQYNIDPLDYLVRVFS
jgi:hypothetical protein